MPRKPKSASLNIRIDPEIKAMVEEDSAKDRRSISSYIEKLILDAHGKNQEKESARE